MALTSGAGPHLAWLSVDGAPFPITSGSVSQSAKRKTSSFNAQIPLSFPGAEAALALIGDNETSITVLTRGTTGQLIVGEIDTVDIDYIGRSIRVTGRDKSAKLHDMKSSEKWQNKKPSDIVTDLIGRAGLKGNVVESALTAGKQLQQDYVKLTDNVSFAFVIHKMAEFDGARWFFDNNGQFQYVPLGNPSGIYSINIDQSSQPIKSDCISLSIRRNVQAGKTIKTTVRSWHPKHAKVYSYTSTVQGRGGPLEYNYHIPNLQQDHVQKHAMSQGNEKARHEISVSATVVGDPSLNASMGLQLNGTNYFDQQLDIDTVHHTFGMAGHRTNITARSAGDGRSAE